MLLSVAHLQPSSVGFLQNRNVPLFGPLFGRNGPFWGVWEPNYETWVPGNGPFFLDWTPFFGSQNMNVGKYENRTTYSMDGPKMHDV